MRVERMNYERIAYRKTEGTGIVTLNRPEVRNALNSQMLWELAHVLDRIAEDPEVRVVVINGNGKCFCAGGDLAEMRGNTPQQQRQFMDLVTSVFSRIERLRKPVIASVHNHALAGGTELILCCDLVVAADDAVFGLREIVVGILPGGGALVRLLRWMGAAKAKELAMTGDPIPAEEAQRIGLVNKVVRRERLDEETMALARKLGKLPPLALGATKATINQGGEMDMDKGIAYGVSECLSLFHTEDQKEGMSAFLEKREPVFRGK
jgi:enoyl-CoA hydratase/carnithine racemase